MKKKTIIFVIALVAVALLFIWLAKSERAQNKSDLSGQIKVVTTLFPLYDIAKNIGGEQALVSQLLPPGVEAHSFEPKPSDIVAINEADIFIYTGKFMEPWVEDILKSVSNKKLIVVDASQGTKMIPCAFHDEDEPAGSLDPHIWLDFDNAQVMATNIENAFTSADATNMALYKQKADGYKNILKSLDLKFKTDLSDCRTKKIIYGGHYAFGYLASRYGLEYSAAQGIAPDSEPSASDLVSLIEQIKSEGINYVFYEELSSPRVAEAIAQETKAKLLFLNAAHNLAKDQFDAGVSLFEILNYDLENLKIGLECK